MFDKNMALLSLPKQNSEENPTTPHRMTFIQYKNRDRGASRKYSIAAKQLNSGEFGALVAEKGDKYEIYDEEMR